MIRMFLTPKYTGPRGTGQREKSDHPTLEEAQRTYARIRIAASSRPSSI